jgi:hypothetical protein
MQDGHRPRGNGLAPEQSIQQQPRVERAIRFGGGDRGEPFLVVDRGPPRRRLESGSSTRLWPFGTAGSTDTDR